MPQPGTKEFKERVERRAETVVETLYDFPLPGGLRLGAADRAAVTDAAERLLKPGRKMVIEGTWLALIGRRMPENGTVEETVSLAVLASLKAKAEKAK